MRFKVLLAVLFSLFAVSAHAQFKASLQGTVQDAKGGVVSGAKVTVTNQDTGAVRETTASDQGFYRISELPPGRYTVTVEAAGFKTSISKGVEVKAEEPRGFDVTVQIGAVSEQVTVTASDEALATENASIGTTVTSDELTRLPEVGRDPYELLRLTPGVFGDASRAGSGGSNNLPNSTGPGGSNSSIFQIENSVQAVANGQRQDANNFTIDGVSVNSLQYGGAAVITPNQESVQEITVLSSSYSAEDGRGTGAQIKVVSKGGTNQYHGSGFFKYQDPNWNAFNKYGGPNNAPPTRVNNNYRQFGGSLGGPIKKDKLFLFFSYEGLRSHSMDTSSPTWVETPQFRQLIIADRPGSIAAKVMNSAGIVPRIATVLTPTCALAGINTPAGAPPQCQVVSGGLDIGSPSGTTGQYLPFTGPNANQVGSAQIGGGLDGIPDIEYVTVSLPGSSSGNQFNGRLDYIRGNNQLSYSSYFTLFNNTTADSAGRSRPQGDLNIQPFNQVQAVSFIHTFSPTMVNEARVNFTRFNFNQIATSANVDFGIPRIKIEGYIFDQNFFGAPQASTTPAIFVENSYNFRDKLTKNIGAHALSAGFDFIAEQNNNDLSGMARPLYVMHLFWNFPNDTPIFEQIDANPQTGGPADAQRYLRSKDYAVFFQDDWKFRPNLTLNFGLRWEYYSPLSDAKNHLTNLEFGSGGVLATSMLVHANSLIPSTKRDVGPRLGFAWSPSRFGGKGTVVRGGAAIAFNRPDDVLFGNAAFNPPNYARFGLCCGTDGGQPGGDVFGSPYAGNSILYAMGASNAYNSYPANPALAFGIDPKTGGVCAGSPCTSDQAVEIYGGSPTYHDAYVYLYSLEVERRLPWSLIATVGYQGSDGHRLTRLLNQNFLQQPSNSWYAVYFPTSDVDSNYNALNLRLRRQFSNGFMFDTQYRFSKSIDQLSNEGPGAVTNQTDPAHPETEHGPSDFDAKHYLNFFTLYDLPFFRDKSRWTGKVLGGWQLNGIMTWHTGFPWTPVTCVIQSVPITNAFNICPVRPTALLQDPPRDTSNHAFMTPGAEFPAIVNSGNCNASNGPIGGTPYFNICPPAGPPGIGRNSFRGPDYFNVDASVAKKFALSNVKFLGEAASLELRGNFFNFFNKLNLEPLSSQTSSVQIESSQFGLSQGGLAGRVIEFQVRLTF
jgi:outer membrane receptor protein involved in Fe transport